MQRKKPMYKKGIRHWRCPSCKKWLSEDSFYSDKHTWNGIRSQCRRCHIETTIKTRDKANTKKLNREHMRRAREKDPEKFKKRERIASKKRVRGEKVIARDLLNRAVRRGDIKTPKICSECLLEKKLTAHHPDYSKPLTVEWKCYECHGSQ